MAVYRATIVSFDNVTWTAKIRVDGSAPQVLDSVATNRGIAAADMAAGRKVLLDTGDHHHPLDFVITTVWA